MIESDYNFDDDEDIDFLQLKQKRDIKNTTVEDRDVNSFRTVEVNSNLNHSLKQAQMRREHRERGGSSSSDSGNNNVSETTSDTSDSDDVIDSALIDVAAQPAPIDLVTDGSKNSESSESSKKNKTKLPVNAKSKTASLEKSKLVKQVKEPGEIAKNIPTSVMDTLRNLFPGRISNADMISAFVYIHSDGNCEISDKAKDVVEKYGKAKEAVEITDQLTMIEHRLKEIVEIGKTVELSTAFLISDRLFGVKRGSSTKNQELRDSNTLDMLENMRASGKNQAKIDAQTKGRNIHLIRSAHDYE